MLKFTGDIGISNAVLFEQKLAASIALSTDSPFVLDLREVRYVDSVALGVIVRCAQALRASGRTMQIQVGANSGIERILNITGLYAYADIVREPIPRPESA